MKRPRPVAQCTMCGKVSRFMDQIGRPCGRRVRGKSCSGVFFGTLDYRDWAECNFCAATGFVEGMPCSRCHGEGWKSKTFIGRERGAL